MQAVGFLPATGAWESWPQRSLSVQTLVLEDTQGYHLEHEECWLHRQHLAVLGFPEPNLVRYLVPATTFQMPNGSIRKDGSKHALTCNRKAWLTMISFGFNSMRRTGMHRTVRWTYRMLQIMMPQQPRNFDPVTFLQPPDNRRPARLASRRVLAAAKQGHTAWCGGVLTSTSSNSRRSHSS